jgi:hypothetical protein
MTCFELFEFNEYTRTNTFDDLIPSMMASAKSTPGVIFRGAIQQRIPFPSRTEQTLSAAALSILE